MAPPSPFDEAVIRSTVEQSPPPKKKWSLSAASTPPSSMVEPLLLEKRFEGEPVGSETLPSPSPPQEQTILVEMEEIDLESEILSERRDGIAEINKSMHQINSIQKDLASIVQSQGEDIEQMAYMSIEAAEHTQSGLEHTVKAATFSGARGFRRTCTLMATLMIMVVMGVSWAYLQHHSIGSTVDDGNGTENIEEP